jgi:hypothetical protein
VNVVEALPSYIGTQLLRYRQHEGEGELALSECLFVVLWNDARVIYPEYNLKAIEGLGKVE